GGLAAAGNEHLSAGLYMDVPTPNRRRITPPPRWTERSDDARDALTFAIGGWPLDASAECLGGTVVGAGDNHGCGCSAQTRSAGPSRLRCRWQGLRWCLTRGKSPALNADAGLWSAGRKVDPGLRLLPFSRRAL